MKSYIKNYAIRSLGISALLIVFSIFLMIKPSESINFIVMMFAGVIAIDGFFHVISYFKVPKELKLFNFELVEGILELVLGAITLINPTWVSAFFPILIGMWIIFSSVIKIQFSLSMKENQNGNWMIIMTLAVITMLLGLLMVFNPITSMITFTTLAGILLFLTEIINIIQYVILLLKLK